MAFGGRSIGRRRHTDVHVDLESRVGGGFCIQKKRRVVVILNRFCSRRGGSGSACPAPVYTRSSSICSPIYACRRALIRRMGSGGTGAAQTPQSLPSPSPDDFQEIPAFDSVFRPPKILREQNKPLSKIK